MHKYLKIGIPLLVLLALILLVIFNNEHKQPLKIGMSLPLTGSVAWMGENYLEGAMLAVTEINSNGGIGGRGVELIVQDNQYTGNGGVEAFRAAQIQGMDFFVSIGSTPTVPSSYLAKDSKIPLMTAATFADILTTNDNAVRFSLTPEVDVRATILQMVQNNHRNVGILYANNEYGQTNINEFKKQALDNNIKIVTEYSFTDIETIKMATYNLVENDLDAIYVIGMNFISEVENIKRWSLLKKENNNIYLNGFAYASNNVTKNSTLFDGVFLNLSPVSLENSEERNFLLKYLNKDLDDQNSFVYQSFGYNNVHSIAAVLNKKSDLDDFALNFSSFGQFETKLGKYNLVSRDIGIEIFPGRFINGKLVTEEDLMLINN